MTSKTAILAAAVSGLFVLAGPAFSTEDGSSEKCFRAGKAGQSDRGRAAHACATQRPDRAEPDQVDGAVHVIAA